MKKCELCKSEARIYCDSDQASLCWTCDARVHSANFLVARHSRCLLCRVCQSTTPWSASGEKLGRTVSICERCVHTHGVMKRGGAQESGVGNDDDDGEIDTDGVYYEEEIDDEEEEEEDDQIDDDNEDGENQVVPWSSSSSPPPAASSSSSEECSGRFFNGGGEVSSKRMFADLYSNDDDLLSSSSEQTKRSPAAVAQATGDGETDFSVSFSSRPSKIGRVDVGHTARDSRSTTAIVESSSSSAGGKNVSAISGLI